ncbi:MAG: AtpZ/AtpI family protein [Flavobacteriales bacterium]|jgi:F0F1-type ATP synthase assembly protein I|nr:AtpZ/AtpI family protein [Flavobacteriales bacterium]
MSDPIRRLPRRTRSGYNSYLRFTGLGLTMVGIILVFCFIGYWLDRILAWKYPVFTIVLSLLGIAGSMAYLFKETGKRDQHHFRA